MPAHPGHITIDKILQKLLCALVADLAVGIDQRVIRELHKHLELPQRSDIEIRQHIVHMLLRQRTAASA